jgi:LysR family hydrogen peroxide-inducible transcriptional activator
MITITQVKYLLALDKTRHFGKAAEMCAVSQPSLSMQIHKLEEDLEVVLFDRNKKPILPTHRGELLIQQAKELMREYDQFLAIGQKDSSEPSGSFKLGVIPTLSPYVLPLFLARFSERFPKVDLVVDELKTEEIIEQLKDDSLDAGILATPLREKGIRENILFYEPFYLYTSKEHPFSKRESVSEKDLSSEGLWLLEDGHCFRNQVVNFCSLGTQSGVYPNVHFEGANFETLRYLIRKTKGYTLFPYLFLKQLGSKEKSSHVKAFNKPVPSREVSLVYQRRQWKLDIVEALDSCIRESVPKELKSQVKGSIEVVPIQ